MSISKCRGQLYEGTSNMTRDQRGAATIILASNMTRDQRGAATIILAREEGAVFSRSMKGPAT